MPSSRPASPRPDGIGPEHEHPPAGLWRHVRPCLSLVVLGAVVAWGLSGWAGGRSATRTAEGPAAVLQVRMPEVIRTGQVYETIVTVRARRDIAEPTVAVASELWQDVTINSTVPTPAEESFRDGRVRLAFGPLAAGETFVFKVDAQINPSRLGVNAGELSLSDGDTPLAALPLAMRILP